MPWTLDYFGTLSAHLQTEKCEPWYDVIFQRYIFATSYRQVLKTLPPQAKHSRYEDLTTDGSVIKFKTLQTAAKGVDDSEEELVEGVVSRLPRYRAIGTGNVGGGGRWCCRWLQETEGEVFPGSRVRTQELS
jgi:hypothetical protein